MIVVAIIAVIAAIAVPGLLRARVAANETSAIGHLKTISTAESQFQSAAIVDQDSDGTGEFGYLQELSGISLYRIAGGGLSTTVTDPAFLSSIFGSTAQGNSGVANRSGYSYLAFLPTELGPATAEADPIPAGFTWADANQQESRFACYAVPAAPGNSGTRAFVVCQQGEVFATVNLDNQDYGGTSTLSGNFPLPGAAYRPEPGFDPQNLDGQFDSTQPGDDGFIWYPAGN